MSSSANPEILLDGRPVNFVVDSSCPFSSRPADSEANSPSHVHSLYPDGFSFSALLHLCFSSLSSLIPSRNWINAESSAFWGVYSICCILSIHYPVFLANPRTSSTMSVPARTRLSPSMWMKLVICLQCLTCAIDTDCCHHFYSLANCIYSIWQHCSIPWYWNSKFVFLVRWTGCQSLTSHSWCYSLGEMFICWKTAFNLATLTDGWLFSSFWIDENQGQDWIEKCIIETEYVWINNVQCNAMCCVVLAQHSIQTMYY